MFGARAGTWLDSVTPSQTRYLTLTPIRRAKVAVPSSTRNRYHSRRRPPRFAGLSALRGLDSGIRKRCRYLGDSEPRPGRPEGPTPAEILSLRHSRTSIMLRLTCWLV